MLLEGKKLLVTGVLTDASFAFAVARHAQEQGAEVVLTGFGRGLSITKRIATKLPSEPDVLELDVTQEEHYAAVVGELDQRWGALDGIVHAIAFAPPSAIGGEFLTTPWDDVATAVRVSTYSFAQFGRHFAPLLAKAGGGSLVGLDFDATVAWPSYDWMGVAKAGLEATCRYLARDLGSQGTRVNLVAAGPVRTIAAKNIAGFGDLGDAWSKRAPLGWDTADPDPVGRAVCALLSDWTPMVTGEILHVDGGAHAMGMDLTPGPSDPA